MEARQAVQHRYNTAKLLVLLNGVRAWARGLPADVDDGGAGVHQVRGMDDGLFLGVIEATIRERVRRHIDNAHEERPVEAAASEGWARRRHTLKHFAQIGVVRLREGTRG